MIYHDEYIVESFFSTTTKQSYYILLSDFQIRQNEACLSRINNALRLYLRNQGVVERTHVYQQMFDIGMLMFINKILIDILE